jgi:predicted permease
MSGLAAREAGVNPDQRGFTTTVQPMLEELNRDARGLLMPLFGAVALVFLVACVNVAGLFVARGLQRHREYALRSALGASRTRLFRQLLTESLALSMASAVVGAAIAVGTVGIFKAIGRHAIPRADAVDVGWPVFAFGFAAALVAALVAGLPPALRASSTQHARGLKGTRTSMGAGERRLLSGIATMQIVFTVALLAGAILLIRTAQNLDRVRPGYDTDHVLAATVTTVTPNAFREFHTRVLERVAAVPGVARAAFVWGLPLTGNNWPGKMELVGQSAPGSPGEQLSVPLRSVTPDYFDLMGIGLVDGRLFTAADATDAPGVVLVNQTLAKRWFPGVNPLGRRMRFAGNEKRTLEIVGVVSDTRTVSLSETPEPEVYLSFWQNGAFSKHLVIRAMGDPRSLTGLVRQAVREVDPTAAVEHATTMTQIRSDSLAPRTFAMRLLIGFALLATVLAMVGIYGVLSLSVGSRVKEMAVRKAVGAQTHDILQLILGEGGRLILVGTALGAVVAVMVGRALEAQLYEVRSADPVSLGGAALLFAMLAIGACLRPALRAARTDLMAALHQE